MSKPSVNIGMVGHVDHGKTTLVSALSGVWTDQHSEEMRRGISIRLGYADVTFRKCPKCPDPDCYTVEKKCTYCDSATKPLRTISFVDSPGHETLMATMLSGAAIMNGAVLVIAANEPCPQPQTKEHLMALNIVGIKNILIVQNKIDLVSREDVIDHYHQIKEFVKGTVAENSPIIPLSAQQNANIDLLILKIEELIPSPTHDLDKPAMMFIARSFDINKPGTPPGKLKGGIIGGTLSQGKFHPKDELEIRPGRLVEHDGRSEWIPIRTVITTMVSGGKGTKEATPGGLLGVGTKLDPILTKSDGLVGQVAGEPGTLPPVWNEKLRMGVNLLDRVVGLTEEIEVTPVKVNETFMLSAGTATTVGVVSRVKKDDVDVTLRRPICANIGSSVAISRRVGSRWHLIGMGTIKDNA
ncbi:MAG: translation initiation factor IF-2 subunit gamma [Halobacteriota archaeon]|nr:translation initiation factor IF-2 subunit gamma [Halobacteriota archaeon]